MEPWVDIHCHCLPGLDDGPATVAAAVQLCRALVEDGIGIAVATPHQLGRYDGTTTAAAIRKARRVLSAALEAAAVPLRVLSPAPTCGSTSGCRPSSKEATC